MSSHPMPPASARFRTLFAWAGGLLFVLSLGYFLYFYLYRLGDPSHFPAAPSTLVAVLANFGLFTLFALHHSLLARPAFKAWMTRWVPGELERSTYTWIASLLFLLTCGAWVRIPGTLYSVDGWPALLLYAVQAGGIVMTALASSAIDVLDLAGIRQVHQGPTAARPDPPRLERRGLYGLVRHPIYLAWALFVFGAPHMTMGRFTFAVVSTSYLVLAIPWEERSLVAAFGSEYRDYQRQVRWKMVPGVY